MKFIAHHVQIVPQFVRVFFEILQDKAINLESEHKMLNYQEKAKQFTFSNLLIKSANFIFLII